MPIKVIGLESIQNDLKTIEKKAHDTQPLTEEIRNHLQNVVEESFEKQVSPTGVAWSPIKKATHKNYRLGTQKLLYRSGAMQGSLYGYASNDSTTVGVNATSNGYPYPIVQQFGNKSKTIEAREFVPIKLSGEIYPNTQREIIEIVEEYFEFVGLKK